jgi:hypothetical protein
MCNCQCACVISRGFKHLQIKSSCRALIPAWLTWGSGANSLFEFIAANRQPARCACEIAASCKWLPLYVLSCYGCVQCLNVEACGVVEHMSCCGTLCLVGNQVVVC